jgi:hypothetical protein
MPETAANLATNTQIDEVTWESRNCTMTAGQTYKVQPFSLWYRLGGRFQLTVWGT